MDITRTRHGLRLSEHGIVISELRTSPGPTHSVFDVLAALVTVLAPANGRVGVLGFAGGGMMAPLKALGWEARIDSVDLDQTGYRLFREHCRRWAGPVRWQRADAVDWLRRQSADFDLLVEDLSVAMEGDVIKPAVTWSPLPRLIHQKLKPGGLAVFNLLPPLGGRWRGELAQVAGHFASALCVELTEFENRILVAGARLASTRELGASLRRALSKMGSRQAARIRVRGLPRREAPIRSNSTRRRVAVA